MELTESTLIILLLILGIGLFITEVFKNFRLPLITLIIIAGAIFGPHGLSYIQLDDTIGFFGFLGMSFLLLMAGLKTDIKQMSKNRKKIFKMALLNGTIPFLFGLIATKVFGYSWLSSVMIGIVFISSSVAIIAPSLEASKSFDKDFLQLVLASIMATDIFSLIILGLIFQNVEPITTIPLPQYYMILLMSIAGLFYLIPRLYSSFFKRILRKENYESQMRFTITIMMGMLLYFSVLGVHPILASFLTGMALSEVVQKDKSGILFTKIHTLGYGLFIPVFFFIIGMEMDIGLFRHFDITNILMIILIIGLPVTKYFSGYLAGRLVRLSKLKSHLFGAITIPQLTTTLAVTYTASSLGILDNTLTTTIILISIVSTIVGPVLVSRLSQ